MKNISSFLLIVFFATLSTNSYATHVVGGEISYQWVSQNNYIIKVKVYRDCNPGNAAMPTSLSLGIYRKGLNTLQQTVTMNNPVITNNLPFGDSCYTPTSLCVDEGVFTSAIITIPNLAAGYYLHTQLYARNGIIDNINSPGSTGMSFYAEMPDPALGQNNSPVFGNYPLDAYFCLNYTKTFNFNAIDADGDSLSYSMIDPLGSVGTTNGTAAGPYSPVAWNTGAGFSLANICGGTPAMNINNLTGDIQATPNTIGEFVFAVRVEEYRNGVKLGEVRRDIQYASLPCVLDAPPTIVLADTVSVYVGEQICVDMLINDADGTDTIYFLPTTTDFNLIATYVAPTFNGSNYSYSNFNGGGTVTFQHYVYNPSTGVFQGVGSIGARYCWTPACEDLNEIYNVNLLAYSLGCSGSDTSQKEVAILVDYTPPPVLLNIPDSLSLILGQYTCLEMIAQDNYNVNETLYIRPSSDVFNFTENFVQPILYSSSGGNTIHYYTNFQGTDTVWITNLAISNGAIGGQQQVALRYCWTTDCDDVFLAEFDMNYMAFSTSCGTDTVYKTSHISIAPPVGEVKPVANVFTPNGDGVNDLFKLAGINDPCYDVMEAIIINRWGVKVFESNDPLFQWDGKNKGRQDCAEGVYFLIINGTYGSTYDPISGLRIPNEVNSRHTIQLIRD